MAAREDAGFGGNSYSALQSIFGYTPKTTTIPVTAAPRTNTAAQAALAAATALVNQGNPSQNAGWGGTPYQAPTQQAAPAFPLPPNPLTTMMQQASVAQQSQARALEKARLDAETALLNNSYTGYDQSGRYNPNADAAQRNDWYASQRVKPLSASFPPPLGSYPAQNAGFGGPRIYPTVYEDQYYGTDSNPYNPPAYEFKQGPNPGVTQQASVPGLGGFGNAAMIPPLASNATAILDALRNLFGANSSQYPMAVSNTGNGLEQVPLPPNVANYAPMGQNTTGNALQALLAMLSGVGGGGGSGAGAAPFVNRPVPDVTGPEPASPYLPFVNPTAPMQAVPPVASTAPPSGANFASQPPYLPILTQPGPSPWPGAPVREGPFARSTRNTFADAVPNIIRTEQTQPQRAGETDDAYILRVMRGVDPVGTASETDEDLLTFFNRAMRGNTSRMVIGGFPTDFSEKFAKPMAATPAKPTSETTPTLPKPFAPTTTNSGGGGGGGGGAAPVATEAGDFADIPEWYRTGFAASLGDMGTYYTEELGGPLQAKSDYESFIVLWSKLTGRYPQPDEAGRLWAQFKLYSGRLGRPAKFSDFLEYLQRFYSRQPASPDVSYLKVGEV